LRIPEIERREEAKKEELSQEFFAFIEIRISPVSLQRIKIIGLPDVFL
jgi:hypothetical protein